MDSHTQEGITTTETQVVGMMVMAPQSIEDMHHALKGELFASRELGHICDSVLAKHRAGIAISYQTVIADLSPQLADTLHAACEAHATAANAWYYSEAIVCAGLRRTVAANLALIAGRANSSLAPEENNQSALEDLLATTEDVINQTKDRIGGVKVDDGVNAEAGAAMILQMAEDGKAGKNAKIKTGLSTIDQLTGGIRPGTVWAVGARPGVGKSVMLWQIAIKAADQGRRVLFVSAEMGASGYFLRFVAARSGLVADAIEDGTLTDHQWMTLARGCSEVAEYGNRITVWDHLGSNMERILPAIQRKVRSGTVDLIMVDFIQRFGAGRLAPKGSNRNTELEVVSRALADLAHTSRVPVVEASQFRRSQSASERPNMSWFRDCGSLEQDCDVAMLLHQPDPENETSVEAIIDKNRQGKVGSRMLVFEPSKMAFYPATMKCDEGGY